MSNKLKKEGFCKDCPNIELKFDKESFWADGRQETVNVNVRCEHEEACKRITKLCKEVWV